MKVKKWKFIISFVMVLPLLILNTQASDKKDEKKRLSLSDKVKKEVVNILHSNEKLHNSFFNYDGAKVESAAKEVLTAISHLSDDKIAKLLEFSKTKLGDIRADKSREVNNQHYHLVSMAFIYIVNKYDVGKQYNAYSCPMVKKKWVQNSQIMAKVHNPYAPEMPHCGVQDTHH